LSKTIAIDTARKKLIIPVAKKLINTLGMDEEKIYVAHIQDGLIVVSEPWDGYAEAIFEQGREAGYEVGYSEGYDDAIEGADYRDSINYDCGLDCDYDCKKCRYGK
jgi:hypothetical protein